jgi:hypothetical protein
MASSSCVYVRLMCVRVCVCIVMSCRELHADCAAPVHRNGRERHHVRRGRLSRPDFDRKTSRAVLGRHRHVGHRSARLHRDQANRCPHLHHPCHICIRSGLTPATSAPRPGSPLPHPHRDWLTAAAYPSLPPPTFRLPWRCLCRCAPRRASAGRPLQATLCRPTERPPPWSPQARGCTR